MYNGSCDKRLGEQLERKAYKMLHKYDRLVVAGVLGRREGKRLCL